MGSNDPKRLKKVIKGYKYWLSPEPEIKLH